MKKSLIKLGTRLSAKVRTYGHRVRISDNGVIYGHSGAHLPFCASLYDTP